ncbi:MAG: MFS transporter, partial [Alphaproteobacteria bacterium]|nr:MFS transporter [Alphaproteobacteria bacterium]
SRDLGLTYAEAGIFVSILHVSSVIANFGSGLAVDLTGRRVLFQGLSLVIGALALFAFGFTKAYLVLCAMIALIGGSNNLWHPPAISYLSSVFPDNRGYVLSIHATGASLGDAVAPLAAGALLAWIGWQGVAIVNAVPVFLFTLVLLVWLMPKDKVQKFGDVDRARGMGVREYLAGLGAIMRDKAVLGLSLAAGVRTMAQSGILMFLPLYLADVLGVEPMVLGTAVMALHLGGMVAGPVAGVLSDRIGRKPIVTAGLAATTIVIVGATFVTNAVAYVACITLMGLTLYAVRPVFHSWLMDMVPAEMGGSAASVMFGIQAVLASLTPLIGGVIADTWGLIEVFYFLAALMLLANLIVVLLPRVEEPTEEEGAGSG